jgi:hypothetical protein
MELLTMRRKRQETDLFNFSFVDILATTVGVLIFIMVLVILNSTDRVPSDAPKKDAEDAAAEAAALTAKIDGLKGKTDELNNSTAAYQATANAADTLAGQLAGQQATNTSLTASNATLTGQRDALGAEVRGLLDDVMQLVDTNEAANNAAAANRRTIPFRIPEQRATTKTPVIFECENGQVFHLAFEGVLNDNAYNIQDLLGTQLITRKPGASGETFAQAKGKSSAFRQVFAKMDKNRNFVQFFVRPDGFDLFLKLRETLWNAGYEINWHAFDKGESILGGGGGGGNTVM